MELHVIQSKIYEIRGVQVMLDADLASLYQVETKALNQAVKRNLKRFPPDFMFQLTEVEYSILKSQFVTSTWGGRRTFPYAFTEQGLAMLSGILNSDVAIEVNISIMRAFVAVRKYLLNNASTSREIEELKGRMKNLEAINKETLSAVNDLSEDIRSELDDIYVALSELSVKQVQERIDEKEEKPRKPIGFKSYDK